MRQKNEERGKTTKKENVAATNNSHHTRQTLINPQSQQGNEALTLTSTRIRKRERECKRYKGKEKGRVSE